MPNPKGNPESLEPLKPRGDEALKSQITVRITESMYRELRECTDDVPGYVREAIREKLDKEKSK
jgi:hypothetical protein